MCGRHHSARPLRAHESRYNLAVRRPFWEPRGARQTSGEGKRRKRRNMMMRRKRCRRRRRNGR
eukprot:2271881-Pyramimonas_sp.AAC.1